MSKKGIVYTALGFPIILLHTNSKRVRGIEVPDVNLNHLQKIVFESLIEKPSNFTGAEVRFIRSYLRLTQVQFAKILHQSGHSIVSQWEKKGLHATGMDYNTEIWLRLYMANTLKRTDLVSYVSTFLEESPFQTRVKPDPLKIDYKSAA